MGKRNFGAAVYAASVALGHGAAHADTRVGVAGAVNPSASGTPPGAVSRQLAVGTDIQFRERVITTADGQAQILFLDQSSLLIGPNSTVVIDEFVYDPATNKGNIAATLTQGSFRYIGGKLSKQGNATLKTPVATLGIRGSDVTVGYNNATSQMNIVTTHGNATLQTGTDVVNLRGGFGATVTGGQVSPPTALTAQQIAAANGQFEGQPGKTGGATQTPTNGDVAKSGLSSSVEAKGLASTEPGAGGGAGGITSFAAPIQLTTNDTQKVPELPPDPPPCVSGCFPPPPPPPPQPEGRTSRVMNGYVAGIGITAGNGVASYGITNDSPETVVVQTVADAQGTGRVFAKFTYQPVGGGIIRSAELQFGDAPGAAPAIQSTFTNDSTFHATQTASASAGLGKIDGTNANVIALMRAEPAGTLTGQACTCSYVTWGVWTATLQTDTNVTNVAPRGLWVAGVLPSVNDPSPQGSAIFNGTAIGVVESDPSRLHSGQFTNNYNFTQRSGLVTISNFNGTTFTSTVNAGSDWRNYSGTVSPASNLTGTVNGSFFGNQAQGPKETGGNFNVQGANGYRASGIFLGSR